MYCLGQHPIDGKKKKIQKGAVLSRGKKAGAPVPPTVYLCMSLLSGRNKMALQVNGKSDSTFDNEGDRNVPS